MSEPQYDWMPEALQSAAQCWCADETKHLQMDATLAKVIARAIAGWMQDCAQAHRNTDYYRQLVISCGTTFGKAAHVQDDGGICEDVLCAKVPELVHSLHQQVAGLRATVETNHKWHQDHDDYDGYAESDLCEQNLKALSSTPVSNYVHKSEVTKAREGAIKDCILELHSYASMMRGAHVNTNDVVAQIKHRLTQLKQEKRE